MKNTVFTGAGVAIVTPMHPDGRVNYDKLHELIDWHIAEGTDAIVICGTTGESSTLTDEEHVECIRHAIEWTAGRIPVIAGTGSNDTSYAIKLSKEAEALGADALLLVTPYYNKTSQRGLIAHFTAIADSVHIPTILYNVPSRTGVTIAPATYKVLSAHPNIVATKEASGNIAAIAQTKALCGDALDIYSGNDNEIVPILALGAKGVISVMSNCLPKETHDICALWLQGKTGESLALQLKLLDFALALFSDVNPIPVKAAMNLLGKEVGECRLPLVPMSEAGLNELKASMARLGLVE